MTSLCSCPLSLQGDRGENGPPGPAGFAGPPVSAKAMAQKHQSVFKQSTLLVDIASFLVFLCSGVIA